MQEPPAGPHTRNRLDGRRRPKPLLSEPIFCGGRGDTYAGKVASLTHGSTGRKKGPRQRKLCGCRASRVPARQGARRAVRGAARRTARHPRTDRASSHRRNARKTKPAAEAAGFVGISGCGGAQSPIPTLPGSGSVAVWKSRMNLRCHPYGSRRPTPSGDARRTPPCRRSDCASCRRSRH